MNQAGAAGPSGSQTLQGSGGHGGVVDGDDWDEDDTMMFLWGNNPHAVERYNNEREKKNEKINQWRSAIGVGQS